MSNNAEWKRKKAAHLWMHGHTPLEMAAELDVMRDTIMSWLNHPEFRHELGILIRELTEQAELETLRLQFVHLSMRHESLNSTPYNQGNLESVQKAMASLKNNDFITKLSQQSPNELPIEILELNGLAAKKKAY